MTRSLVAGCGRELGLASVAAVLSLGAGYRWYASGPTETWPRPVAPAMVTTAFGFNDDSLDRALDILVNNDPFRLSNRPADGGAREAQLSALPGEPARPSPSSTQPPLSVSAIVGGPPWSAVVVGIPGRNGGIVVRAGERVDNLVIRRVTPDSVVIQGTDTTWRLVMGGPAR